MDNSLVSCFLTHGVEGLLAGMNPLAPPITVEFYTS